MAISKEKNPGKKSPALSFRSGQRIRSRGIFKLIFEKGRAAKGSLINVWVYDAAPESGCAQLGVVVSRKTSASSVVRNRWKRRMREAFRRHQTQIKSGAKIILQARYLKEAPSYEAIEKEMLLLLGKAKILK